MLLLHHLSSNPAVTQSTSHSGSKKNTKVWGIRAVQDALGNDVCSRIHFAHAFGGCDTTSAVFSLGKLLSLEKLTGSDFFQTQADVFLLQEESDKQYGGAAGESALVYLCGGRPDDKLDKLRYIKY